MTKLEIEDEINARVIFKMNELLTGVKNRVGFKYQQAFDMTRESEQAWKAFEELEGMFKKEIKLPTPIDNMAMVKKWKNKEKAVDKMKELISFKDGHELHHKLSKIVNIIEEAQDWRGND
jgi:hypothetical protein